MSEGGLLQLKAEGGERVLLMSVLGKGSPRVIDRVASTLPSQFELIGSGDGNEICTRMSQILVCHER